MDWFFGCFGGIGKKGRKHGDSQKVPQTRPFQPLPVKVFPPSSIALKAFAVRKEATNQEDVLQERKFSSTLATKAEGILISERTPEKQKKVEPWSQLEDLEEELEDLRKQIEKETLDAKKIKEEVTFLRSCGTLLQTPAELRKKDRPKEIQLGITPLKGWHSWLVPSSPTSKLQFAEPSKSQLAAEHVCGNISHRVQTPIIESKSKRKEGNVQAASSSMLGQEKEEVVNSHFGFQKTAAAQQGVDVYDSSIASSDWKQGVIRLEKLCNGTPMNDDSTTEEEVLLASSKVESHVLKSCNENAIMTCENIPSHPKRLKIPTTTDAAKEAENFFTNMGHEEQAHTFNAVQTPFIVETANFRSRTTVKGTPQSTKHWHHTEESNNCASHMIPQSPSLSSSGLTDDPGERLKPSPMTSSSYHEHRAAFEGISHSKQDGYSGGGYKEGSCYDRHDDSQLHTLDSTSSTSMNSEETLTDLSAENSFLPSEIRTPHESITSCKGEDSAAAGFCVEETASVTLYSYGSTQHSVAQSGRRIAQAARYGCEYDESEYDNLSSDAISHVSVECSQSSRYKQIIGYTARFVRQEDQNFIKTPFKMSQWIATPEFQRSPKVRSRPASPVLTPVRWKQLKRTKDTLEMGFESNEQGDKNTCIAKSSFENHNFAGIKASTVRPRTGCRVEGTQEEGWGENEHGLWMNPPGVCVCKEQGDKCRLGPETEFASSNMSLSQWLTPSPGQRRGCSLESPTPLLRNHNTPHEIDAKTTSSLWTPMYANECVELVSRAPEAMPIHVDMSLSNWLNAFSKQDQGRCSEVTPTGLVRHGSHSRDPNERPILAIITGDNYSNSATARRGQWDGKGIPNTTTKYKEDSRVSWHASPFEIRLERALNKQGEVLNKTCFEVASSSPVSNRLKNLQDL